ncbi:hypothetical protein [Halosegnis longus]|uniref:hypothetical protein n=1 Tax=Halosegnis longus TaxID=2216012 RepID=UPI00129E5C0F|nr:hypothetical protein [Halosegnis longus]
MSDGGVPAISDEPCPMYHEQGHYFEFMDVVTINTAGTPGALERCDCGEYRIVPLPEDTPLQP